MPSFVDSSVNIVDNESSSSSATSSSASLLLDYSSYDWVDPTVLKIPTRLWDPDKLDAFFFFFF